RIAGALAPATSAGPPVVGVGWRAWPSTTWAASTTTAWIFVPPRSMPPRVAPFGVVMTRHAMTMKPRRWKTPFAITATVAAAEAAVLLLRPRRDPIEPAPVRAADYFSDGELQRARAFRRPQRPIALAGLALDAGLLGC